MKPVVIIAIAVGVSVVAVLGVLIGIGAYQQAQLEKEQREANQAFINLMQKVAESEQEQSTTQPAKSTPPLPPQDCPDSAGCIVRYVTEIIDGDTIKVDGQSIRFAFVDAPEINVTKGKLARAYIEEICPVGSPVLVDEDDGQTKGSYGRIIAVIYCNGMNLNQAVLDKGHADINEIFCEVSEFSNESWVKKYGCTQTKENNCAPSYPDVCIPPSPPDLNCSQIQYRNFKVLPPDPHRFDNDKDGIGCEK